MNNNGRKRMSSKKAAELSSSSAARTVPRTLSSTPSKVGTEIRNLPDNITLTQEILQNNICRICATYYETGPMLVPLYLCDGGGKPLAKTVNLFLPIKVKESDRMPKFVCRICANKLYAWREMWNNCVEVDNMLFSQSELLEGFPLYNRVDTSHLTETVQSVLATYSLNSSMELVCQKCNSKTSSGEFCQHLRSSHVDVRDREAVEAFVRDHVTFEEALDSDSDGDRTSVESSAPEAPEVSSIERPLCDTAFIPRSSGLFHRITKHAASPKSRNKTELLKHPAKKSDSVTRIARGRPDSTSDVASTSRTADETNQKRIPAVCPDCNRTFSNKYNMLNHMKSHGEASAKFECECGRSYTTRGNLVAHRKIAHLRVLPHACSECGEGFPSRSSRDAHARLHSGLRPYACPVCARTFRAKNSRDKHRETHAPRRFRCELCGNKFRRKAHLRYHVGTHRRNTLHFVDLVDSSDEEIEALGDMIPNREDVETPLAQDSAEEFVWRYVLGSWAPMT